MYVIVVYDVNVERVSQVCQFLRRFLHWVQNSVFEGELTESEFMKVKNGIKKLIKESEDSVRFYILSSEKYIKRETIGTEKSEISNII
ncbi:CRISPR-associated endonuclease Cas2 [Desulfurobacterium sp.]|uniref:CRISPR-associated endonuclease Cas2 n=1 Tax=Desulfurobacterium sp. TaxID=2004706 RepID=UPI002629B9C7|nr:CRISPR-associated endonuclease Cas2 [Desulfurobacterium sp.]